MQRNFPESDWKTLSRLKPLALDRLCRRILQEAGGILDRAQEGGHHRAYLELFKHIQSNDKRLSNCFDDWKRSQAFFILVNWRREKLVTEEEFAAFSAETRIVVEGLSKM
jgi:hypothetical protein